MNIPILFQEPFIKINFNLLETNIINICFVLIILFYSYKTSFEFTLINRQKIIINTIENSQKDLFKALELYFLIQNIFEQSIFCFSFWKKVYQNKKICLINFKYRSIFQSLIYFFTCLNSLLQNVDKKSNIILRNYLLLILGSRILRIFLSFSNENQIKISQFTLNKLKKIKNDK